MFKQINDQVLKSMKYASYDLNMKIIRQKFLIYV